MLAAAHGKESTVKLLLEHGAVAHIRDLRGNSAATYAKSKGYNRIVDMLAKHQ
jgi:ankyrin repeat protein